MFCVYWVVGRGSLKKLQVGENKIKFINLSVKLDSHYQPLSDQSSDNV